MDTRVLRLRRQLVVLAIILILSVIFNVLLASAVVVSRRTRYARMILIDDRVACYVKSADAAEQVKERLLQEKRDALGAEVQFKQSWLDMLVKAEGEEILEIDDAVKLLSGKISILVSCYAIAIEGEDVAYVPTEADADVVLKTVKAMYVGDGEEAVSQDFETPPLKRPFTIPPEKLDTDLHAVAGRLARLVTVKTIKRLLVRDVKYWAPREVHETPLLPAGKEEVVDPGAPGTQDVLVQVELLNNEEVSRKHVDYMPKVPAKPERVRVGTGPAEGG